ncbi:MAG: isoleucine--tRNA ligase [Thermoanaerobaculia bacterium]|nr:isoleucine--tRNA ligase [Thermoanaerobaculia bacterium]
MADKEDLKKTLNLPKTELAMKANLPQNEPKRLEKWAAIDLYGQIRRMSAGRRKYVLHDGPPYANGHIHIGHALNKILKDIVVKSRTMMGYDSPYVPGWDCHGLPIEHRVDKELGPKKKEMSSVEFRRACREFAGKFVEIQKEDFKRLGVLGDWENPYTTMSYGYEADIADALGRFFKEGLVYKGLKPVHWCTHCQTALAEAEVEYDEHTSPSVFVRFPLGPDAAQALGIAPGEAAFAVIWTTTPWTLPANLAIALHPSHDYAVVRVPDGLHIVAAELLDGVAKKAGWSDPQILRTFKGPELDRKSYRHAFLERDGIFVVGDHVTLEAGTGLVHTAPGHGADDYRIGVDYGLEVYTPVNHRGEFTADVIEWAGTHVFKANPLIVERMKERGVLLASENIRHSYPHCWRCKNPIIFRATEQWFIAMDKTSASGKAPLRERAAGEISKVEWLPRWGEERIRGMVENRPDWCISRQRLWGVPITVLYCEGCSETVCDEEFFARVVAAFREEGADAWYAHPAERFLPEGFRCKCGGSSFRKENDILDVWFDSGCSHVAVLKSREELGWPCAVYLEGHDQHRGWFQSSLLVGTGIEGGAPYGQVVTCGFVVDEKGRKMSKSMGNVVAPEDVIKKHGGDILRMWVSMIDYRDDMAIGNEIIARISEAYLKIRNTCRFMLGNLADYADFDPAKDALPFAEMDPLDRWAVSRANETFERCIKGYEDLEFHVIYHKLLELSTVDMSALYFDVIKDTLYIEAKDSKLRRSAQTALHMILSGLVRVVAPIMSFTADEIWERMGGAAEASVHLAAFPDFSSARISDAETAAWDRILRVREAANKVLERARAAQKIGKSLEADIVLTGDFAPEALTGGVAADDLARVMIVSHVDFDRGSSESDAEALVFDGIGTVGIVMRPARGTKCMRCWQYREEVSDARGTCDRCAEIVSRS